MFPISADDFPREPGEQSYRAQVSSGGTVCTVLNNVPKTREVVEEKVFYSLITLRKSGWNQAS